MVPGHVLPPLPVPIGVEPEEREPPSDERRRRGDRQPRDELSDLVRQAIVDGELETAPGAVGSGSRPGTCPASWRPWSALRPGVSALVFIRPRSRSRAERAAPASALDRNAATSSPTAFVSGDDHAAKQLVRTILHSIGWNDDRILDLGGISTARGTEAMALMVPSLLGTLGLVPFALTVAH